MEERVDFMVERSDVQANADREAEEKALSETLSRIGHKLVVISGKGGVGKSTIAVNLAYGLAVRGQRVGILDVDIHGPNVAKMLGLDGQRLAVGPGGKMAPLEVDTVKVMSMASLLDDPDSPVVWRGPLKMGAIKQFLTEIDWGVLDYLVVDAPPGTGDEPLSVCQLIPDLDGSIIVTTPQEVALLDSRKCVRFSKLLKVPLLGIVENMSGLICPHCGGRIDLFKTGGGGRAAVELGVPFLGKLPIEPEIVSSGDEGRPFVHHNGESEAGQAMNAIVDRIMTAVSGGKSPGASGDLDRQSRSKTPEKPVEKEDAMKRIAIAVEDDLGLESEVSMHFGRCSHYTFVEVEDGEVSTFRVVGNPYYEAHTPGAVPNFIREEGADVMVAGGMGPRAIGMFEEFGIEVVTGGVGKALDVLDAYLSGELTGIQPCAEHSGHEHV